MGQSGSRARSGEYLPARWSITGTRGRVLPRRKACPGNPLRQWKTGRRIDRIWYPNGQKKLEGNYHNDVKDGIEVRLTSAGVKYLEMNYAAGEKHGLVARWRDSTHQELEQHYAHDVLDGVERRWQPNGQHGSSSLSAAGSRDIKTDRRNAGLPLVNHLSAKPIIKPVSGTGSFVNGLPPGKLKAKLITSKACLMAKSRTGLLTAFKVPEAEYSLG